MLRVLLVGLMLAVSSSAQVCAYTGSTDPGNGGTASGTALFYGATHRHHILIDASLFANVPYLISDISVAVKRGWRRVQWDNLTIRMGHTTQTTLQIAFASNITSPLQVVLEADDYAVFQGVGPAWVPVGLQRPFRFSPALGNLLIEIIESGGSQSTGGGYSQEAPRWLGERRAAAFVGPVLPVVSNSANPPPAIRLCMDKAGLLLLGESCSGASASSPLLGLSGAPELGGQSTFWLSGGTPGALALLAFGFENSAPYPVDLTVLGAPGCRQYFGVSHSVALLADSVGVAQHDLAIPASPALVGTILYGQFLALAPTANTLGALTSNYGRLLIGR